MRTLSFTKTQGLGNDFVVVDASSADPSIDWQALAVRLCDRHFGIGADGLLCVLPSEVADFRMRVLNADGTEPEMCGNGLRCFARYLRHHGLVTRTELAIETGAGVLEVSWVRDAAGHATLARVDMGPARLAREQIPMQGPAAPQVIEEPLQVGDRTFWVTGVSMGNPHAVLFVPSFDEQEFLTYGPLLEGHTAFPKRANVEFVEVVARDRLRVKVFERGVGPTLACGTGACAALVASVLTGRAERRAEVELPGGSLEIEWAPDGRVLMTGPAEVVYTGSFELSAFLPLLKAS